MKQSSKQLNNKGFSIGIVLVLLVVLLGIGASGWYVWQRQRSNKKTEVTQQPEVSTKKTEADPTADWETKCSTSTKLCIKHPAGWVATDAPYDPDNDVLEGFSLQKTGSGLKIVYVPEVPGLGGVCDVGQCFFQTATLKNSVLDPEVKVFSGIFTSKVLETEYTVMAGLMSQKLVANYELAVNQNVDVGFFVDTFIDGARASRLYMVSDQSFDSEPQAQALLDSANAQTALQILATAYYK